MRRALKKEDIYRGSLVLVNKSHPIVQEIPEQALLSLDRGPEMRLEQQACRMLKSLLSELGNPEEIVPVSGYRTRAEQIQIYQDTLVTEGEDFTRKFVALPGCSEHETGLAIDLGLRQEHIDFVRPEFPRDGICGTFRRRASDYGFVERYQAGKEAVTGIAEEPWHFRYVGYPHAELMNQLGLALEEYLEFLKQYSAEHHFCYTTSHGQHTELFYVPIDKENKVSFLLAGEQLFQVSGDNEQGCVVTVWRG